MVQVSLLYHGLLLYIFVAILVVKNMIRWVRYRRIPTPDLIKEFEEGKEIEQPTSEEDSTKVTSDTKSPPKDEESKVQNNTEEVKKVITESYVDMAKEDTVQEESKEEEKIKEEPDLFIDEEMKEDR